jgi:hypothetical protein
MRNFYLSRALSVFAITTLASCGGAAAPGPMALSPTDGQARTHAWASWMNPQEARGNSTLLYSGDSNGSTVYVYDYADGSLVGMLAGFNSPAGGCVDARGDVFITNQGNGATLEFKHGGNKPIRQYNAIPSGVGCSVDRNGNLAIAVQPLSSGPAKLCVWKAGKGPSKCYTDNYCGTMQSPGYDDTGNLYVEGYYYGPAVCELPAGGAALKTVKLSGGTLNFPGGVMWDGKHLALSDPHTGTAHMTTSLYRVTESPSGDLRIVGTTVLNGTCNTDNAWVVQPFIVGRKNTPINDREGQVVVSPDYFCTSQWPIDFWRYPGGADPFKVWPQHFLPGGVVVSRGA